ncbi:nuclear distribution protein [Thozetella sp. PMI_491]|nr:nuclear distribution protein [Thozetella sp. PMI_491]
MEDTLDKTTTATISLLEARLLRIEHILYGSSLVTARSPSGSALDSLADLERRLSSLLGRIRVYAELAKIYKANPGLFQPAAPDQVPTQLSEDALRATVLSLATSFPSTVSALTAVTSDTPVPEPALSASLAALLPRMTGIEATQLAQEAEIAELRTRSEQVLRSWYEGRVLGYSQFVANVEGRVEKIERSVKRAEWVKEMDAEAT